MAIVTSLNGFAGEASFIGIVAWELGGAVMVGAAIGVPALTRRRNRAVRH